MTTQNNQKKLNFFTITSTYQACGIIEGFVQIPDHVDTEQATKQAWQFLIDTGACWHLQGWYGRNARTLIDHGICKAPQDDKKS